MTIIYNSVLLISAFAFSFLATWGAYVLLKRYGVVDVPVERSNHKEPIPRGGGIGIVFSLVCFLLVISAPGSLVTGLLVLAAVSFWDDVKGVAPKWRLLAQVLMVFWVLLTAYQGRIFPEWLPFWLEVPVLAVAYVWFINLFNFMDGADGMASSEAICIALGAFILGVSIYALPVDIMLFGMLIVGSVLGFALWNWHPAKLFMGDVGSVPLGFILGFVLLALAADGFWHAALILPAYFIADATITLLARAVRGEKIFHAHSRHCYQRAIRGGLAHDVVARHVVGLNLVLIVLAVVSTLGSLWALAALCAAYGFSGFLMIYFISRGSAPRDLQAQEG